MLAWGWNGMGMGRKGPGGLTEVEATPSKPDGAVTELQSPMVAGVDVSALGGSCATLLDAPMTCFAADFSFFTAGAAALDPDPG
jgi:hypothetical protein